MPLNKQILPPTIIGSIKLILPIYPAITKGIAFAIEIKLVTIPITSPRIFTGVIRTIRLELNEVVNA